MGNKSMGNGKIRKVNCEISNENGKTGRNNFKVIRGK